jgi:hypothetical protein
MKKLSFIIVCAIISLAAMSQKAVINFEEKSYDFGKVNEEDGKITHVFEFKNKGNSPLVVNRAQAQCGCTTPEWTKEPIETGKNGSISVTYNPLGRPGEFTKTITVYSNASEEQFLLTIHGEVVPKQTGDNSEYPIKIGGLGLKTKVLQMNNVEKGKMQSRVLEIQNNTKNPITPTLDNIPSYITAIVSPATLKPNEEAKITFTFNSKACNLWGPISDNIFIVLNGEKKVSEDYKLVVISNVIDDFSKMTLDEKRKSPILEITQRTLNMGVLKTDTKRVGKYKIENKGQNSLEIRRIINYNHEFTIKQPKLSVRSGGAVDLIVDLNTKGLGVGEYKKQFTIQTNDPDNSFLILSVGWTIK